MALRRSIITFGLLALFTLSLSGCFRWHIKTIEQGNVITPHALHSLHRGMTRRQVITKLGSPLLNQLFDDGTVRYVYYLQPNKGPIHRQLVYIHFVNNRVTQIQTHIHERPNGIVWTRTHYQTDFVPVPPNTPHAH